MLVLTRHVHQSIVIGQDVVVTVLEVRGDQVRLGITAPKDIQVHREEVFAALNAANRESQRQPDLDLGAGHGGAGPSEPSEGGEVPAQRDEVAERAKLQAGGTGPAGASPRADSGGRDRGARGLVGADGGEIEVGRAGAGGAGPGRAEEGPLGANGRGRRPAATGQNLGPLGKRTADLGRPG